jgi:hypothetical protein
MRRVAVWMLAFGMMVSPVALAANGKDTDKAPSNSSKKDSKNENKNATPAAPSNSEIAAEVEQLRLLLKEQAEQIAELRAALERRDGTSSSASAANAAGTPAVVTNSSATGLSASNLSAPANPAAAPPASRQDPEKKESPLSFRIGGAEFTPGGFVDFANIFRSTNTGNTVGTNFFAIPYSNTVGGHLTEFRMTGQNSRVSLKVTDKFGANDVTGYLEMDLLGNDAANVFVTSNSHTERLRLYWLDLKRGKWEFLGGQTWGLQTPNRFGVSPLPKDVFYSNNEDTNYQVGLPWTRAAEFRVGYHFNDNWVWAVAIQNPQQFLGQGAEVIFPQVFNAALSVQGDAGNNSGTPNLAPDVITKVAYDSDPGGRHFHFEAGGLMTTAKITIVQQVTPFTFESHTKVGGGVLAAGNYELAKNFRFVANGIYGNGIGRYLFGMGPQFVVVPVQVGPTAFDAMPSLVHAAGGIAGFEAKVTNNTEFDAYYGGTYFQRNSFCDPTNPAAGTCAGHPFIGFGGPNSNNTANKSIQEGTLGWTQTFWKNPQYGALSLITQYSYVTRSPWFVPLGAPKNAHLSMGYVSLRYVLP